MQRACQSVQRRRIHAIHECGKSFPLRTCCAKEGDIFQPRTIGSLESSLVWSAETGQRRGAACLTIEHVVAWNFTAKTYDLPLADSNPRRPHQFRCFR